MSPFRSRTHHRLMQSIRIRKMTCSLKDLSYVIWEKILIIHKSTLIRFFASILRMKNLLSRSLMWSTLLYSLLHSQSLSPCLNQQHLTSLTISSSCKVVFTWHLGLHSHQVSLLTLHLRCLNVGGLSPWTTFPSSCTWYFLQVLFASLMAVSASLKLAVPSWVSPQNPALDI